MPELPEVEAIRRTLNQVQGRSISSVIARDELVYGDNVDPDRARDRLEGETIQSFRRFGKYLVTDVQSGSLIYSLRMTGRVLLVDDETAPDPDYVKLKCGFDGTNQSLLFTSVRRLSRLYWFDGEDVNNEEHLARLGPDPLGGEFTFEQFQEAFDGRSAPIKTLLMDQGFVAGIGNIYASELCFLTGIDPRRPADSLSGEERRRLHQRIPELLERATAMGGSSFTNFVGADGEAGSFQTEHRVYNREGEACPECGSPITKITLSNRSTYFCDQCQQ